MVKSKSLKKKKASVKKKQRVLQVVTNRKNSNSCAGQVLTEDLLTEDDEGRRGGGEGELLQDGNGRKKKGLFPSLLTVMRDLVTGRGDVAAASRSGSCSSDSVTLGKSFSSISSTTEPALCSDSVNSSSEVASTVGSVCTGKELRGEKMEEKEEEKEEEEEEEREVKVYKTRSFRKTAHARKRKLYIEQYKNQPRKSHRLQNDQDNNNQGGTSAIEKKKKRAVVLPARRSARISGNDSEATCGNASNYGNSGCCNGGGSEEKSEMDGKKKKGGSKPFDLLDYSDDFCSVCEGDGELLVCEGKCLRAFHKECLAISQQENEKKSREEVADSAPKDSADCIVPLKVEDKFVCHECKTNTHACFACGEGPSSDMGPEQRAENATYRCRHKSCGKYYHIRCINGLHLSQHLKPEEFLCPRHTCASCQQPASVMSTKKKVIRCVRCPVTYHYDGDCFPVNAFVFLDGSNAYMLCGKHIADPSYKSIAMNSEVSSTVKTVQAQAKSKKKSTAKKNAHSNKKRYHWDFCLYCGTGGSLICCDGCAAAVHETCVESIPFPPSSNADQLWHCQYCMNGKGILAGDVVWAKYGGNRWWPSIVKDRDIEEELPASLRRKPHADSDIPVVFCGYNSWGWITNGNVISFDAPYSEKEVKKAHPKFQEAYREADEIHKKAVATKEKQLSRAKKEKPKYSKIPKNTYAHKKVLAKAEASADVPESKCTCKSTCDENCLNRCTFVDCNDKICAVGPKKCGNRRFADHKYAEVAMIDAGDRGWGLKTLQDIKKGDFVIEYVGEMITKEEANSRILSAQANGSNTFYILEVNSELAVDARYKGNPARFINHSCTPNCVTEKWTVNGLPCIGIFAMEDISADTELSFDYQWEDISGTMAKECRCGSENCSGVFGKKPKKAVMPAGEDGTKKASKKKKKKKKKKQASDMNADIPVVQANQASEGQDEEMSEGSVVKEKLVAEGVAGVLANGEESKPPQETHPELEEASNENVKSAEEEKPKSKKRKFHPSCSNAKGGKSTGNDGNSKAKKKVKQSAKQQQQTKSFKKPLMPINSQSGCGGK
eukprot:Nk52_evm33s24 gene=Nk52_evmTU33s24